MVPEIGQKRLSRNAHLEQYQKCRGNQQILRSASNVFQLMVGKSVIYSMYKVVKLHEPDLHCFEWEMIFFCLTGFQSKTKEVPGL